MSQFRLKKNTFNGYLLKYKFNRSEVELVYKTCRTKNILLPLSKDKPVRAPIFPDKQYYITPIGLFSNPGFVLDCVFEDTEREFKIPMEKPCVSNIKLNPLQETIVAELKKQTDDIITKNKAPPYITLVAECSIGKTVISIHLLSELKMKTLIITPSIDLGQQWCNSIEKFVPGADVFVSKQGARKLLAMKNAHDILIVPSKHLSNEEFTSFVTDNYSVCFLDEQHTYNMADNENLCSFFTMNSFTRVFSLTATPRPINSLFFGREVVVEELINRSKRNNFTKEAYDISLLKYENYPLSDYYTSYLKSLKSSSRSKDDLLYRSILKKRCLLDDQNRMNVVIRMIKESYSEKRKILVLTPFVDDIKNIKNSLGTLPNVFEVHAENKDELESVKEKSKALDTYIIIGTEKHLGTGIDIQELDTLHLVSVTSNERNLIQYAGRVSRNNSTPVHKIFLYSISSYPAIKLGPECFNMMNILEKKGWKKNGRKII